MSSTATRPSRTSRPAWLWWVTILLVGVWLAGSGIVPPSLVVPPVLLAQDTAWTLKPLPANVSYLDTLYFIDDQAGWAVGYADDPGGAVILKTTNAGDDWTTQLTALDSEIASLHMADANTGYGVGMQAYKTTNGGADWVEQAVHDEVWETLHDVFCVSATTAVAVGIDYQQDQALIYRTIDGANWTQPAYPAIAFGQLNAVTFVDAMHGWAVGKEESSSRPLILHSSDGGANWAEQPNPATVGELQRAFFLDALNGWAVGGTGDGAGDSALFLQTVDGGATWTVGNEPPGTIARSAHMVSASEGYVVVNESAPAGSWSAALYYTEDGGVTWTEALAAVAGGYFGNVQIVNSSGSVARGEADRPGTLFQATQQGQTAFGAGSRNNGPMFGSASLGGSAPPQLTRIDIAPSSVTMNVGGTQIFNAQGFDQSGNPIPITPIWSASGGTITEGGEYTATEPGDFTITASVQGSVVQGTATVHVDPPALTRIDIVPSSVTMNVGGTQIFNAQGFDQNGNPIPITPSWSEGGGAISAGGGMRATAANTDTQQIHYIAGNLPGRYWIAAAAGEIESHAWVTILGVAPPDLAPGASYEHTFSTSGIYTYYDGHDFGLQGAVEVVSPTARAGLALGTTTVISITATGFAPSTVTIGVGDTVRWVNADAGPHAIRGGEPYRVCLPLAVHGSLSSFQAPAVQPQGVISPTSSFLRYLVTGVCAGQRAFVGRLVDRWRHPSGL